MLSISFRIIQRLASWQNETDFEGKLPQTTFLFFNRQRKKERERKADIWGCVTCKSKGNIGAWKCLSA